MFTTPQQRAAMARGPVGINASGPELIKASSTAGPDLGTRRGGTGAAPADLIPTNPGLDSADIDSSKPGSRKRRRDSITNPDETSTPTPDAETLSQSGLLTQTPVSYTHLTLPTNREV